MKPQIIYEDDSILVLSKPAGLVVNRAQTVRGGSLQDWLDSYLKIKPSASPDVFARRSGLAHRLDKDTSGLLLIAKNSDAFFYLKNLFQTKKIKKYYLALVHGKPKEPGGAISSPLGRIGMKRTTKVSGKKLIDKKEAETNYKTIKNYENYTLLELSPKTGRTHQLRVHLNSIGHPIAGDKIYGFKKLPDPVGLSRLFLHAYKLNFTTPTGKALSLETDLPKELQKILNDVE